MQKQTLHLKNYVAGAAGLEQPHFLSVDAKKWDKSCGRTRGEVFQQYRKNYSITSLLGLGVLLALFLLLIPHTVLAAPTPGATDQILAGIQATLTPVVSVLQKLLWPILLMIGSLLQNDLLFGAGMEERLLLIWVNIRNLVNILFVFILLAIAFFNIMGAGENYHLKKELPKFIIALIAVNFTYIAAKVLLDGVNIVSTALFALPSSVQAGLKVPDSDPKNHKIGILTKEQIDGICSGIVGEQVGSVAYFKKFKERKTDTTICGQEEKDGSILTEDAKKFFSKFNANNAALVLAVAMGKTNLLDKVVVPADDLTIGKLIQNSLFSVILYAIYATAFIALFVTLLVRIVVLWVMIALSPLMVLKYVLPQNVVGSLAEVGDLQKKFVKHVIIPIPIALVLSIGFIMLDALRTVDFSKIKSNVGLNFLKSNTVNLDLLTSGISTLQEFVIAIGMVAFVWVGVFAALKDTAADKAVQWIQGAVSGVGGFLGKLPLMAPIFPVAGGKMASLGEIGYGLQQAQHFPEQQFAKGAEEKGLLLGRGGASEVASRIDSARTIPDFRKNAGQVYDVFHDEPNIQKSTARIMENNMGEFRNAFNKMTVKGNYKTAEEFLKALKDGSVRDATVARSFLDALKVKRESLPGGARESVSKQDILSPDESAQLEKTKLTALEKDGKINRQERAKLDKLNEAIKSDKPEEIEKAKKEAEPILKRLIETEKASSRIAYNMRIDFPKEKAVTSEAAAAFERKLEDQAKVLSDAGMEKDKAKKEVINAAAAAMDDGQRGEFKNMATAGSLLRQAAETKVAAPATATRTSAAPPAPTPIAKPAAPAAPATPPAPAPAKPPAPPPSKASGVNPASWTKP